MKTLEVILEIVFMAPVWTFVVLLGYAIRYILTGKEF